MLLENKNGSEVLFSYVTDICIHVTDKGTAQEMYVRNKIHRFQNLNALLYAYAQGFFFRLSFH